MAKKPDDNVSNLIDSLCSMICSIEATQQRLNAAKEMLTQASRRNDKINSVLEHCTADMQLSEKLVLSVLTTVETVIQTQAA